MQRYTCTSHVQRKAANEGNYTDSGAWKPGAGSCWFGHSGRVIRDNQPSMIGAVGSASLVTVTNLWLVLALQHLVGYVSAGYYVLLTLQSVNVGRSPISISQCHCNLSFFSMSLSIFHCIVDLIQSLICGSLCLITHTSLNLKASNYCFKVNVLAINFFQHEMWKCCN